jgi:hypothetical protein
MKTLIALLALTACGSSTTAGLPFTPNSQLAVEPVDGGQDPRYLLIAIAEIDQGPLDCVDSFDAGIHGLSGQVLEITIANPDGSAMTVGTYPVVFHDLLIPDGGTGASLVMAPVNSDAGQTVLGVSGSVNLTAVGATVVGNFNADTVNLSGVAGSLAASFSATFCPQ